MGEAVSRNIHRIGIVGGMGPAAGVLLQELIIEMTPAKRDQDHLEVICYTNPKIPDRSASLQKDGGDSFVGAIVDSIKVLDSAGVDVIIIPCNTAHARIDTIREKSPIPVLSIIEAVTRALRSVLAKDSVVSCLATTQTILTGIYPATAPEYKWRSPDESVQEKLFNLIYDIKAGKLTKADDRLLEIVKVEVAHGAKAIVLGCSELSLYYKEVVEAFPSILILDPLRSVASELIEQALLDVPTHRISVADIV